MTDTTRATFHADFNIHNNVMPGAVPQHMIVDEPMFHSASLDFARAFGGPLTKKALDAMSFATTFDVPEGFHWVIDTRSHMLMPGQFPAIPGWHCDGVPRAGYHEQPDLSQLDQAVRHIVVHVSTEKGGVSNTDFIVQHGVNIPEIDPEHVWRSVHNYVVSRADLGCFSPGDGNLMEFGMPTLHRATPARTRGWRWWFRASMYYRKPINDLRRHVQVYTVGEGGGW